MQYADNLNEISLEEFSEIAKDKEEGYGGQTHEDQRLVLPEHSSNLPS